MDNKTKIKKIENLLKLTYCLENIAEFTKTRSNRLINKKIKKKKFKSHKLENK